MQIIKVDRKNPDIDIVKKVADVIKSGGVVIMPTDTVYGMFCDALNKKAVDKVLLLKKRDSTKGFILLLHPIDKVSSYIKPNSLILKILKSFPRQSFSFVLLRRKYLPKFLSPDTKTVAFHFFFSNFEKELFKYIDIPLIGTSANISNNPSANSTKIVIKYFKSNDSSTLVPDLILDGGKLPTNKASIIIDLTKRNAKVLRNECFSNEILENKLKELENDTCIKF